MEIDSFTIVVATGAVLLILGLMFVFMWSQDQKARWLIWFAIPYFLGSCAVVFIAPREKLPNLLTMGLGASLVLMALSGFWIGARVFEGRAPVLWPMLLTGIGWMALFALPGFDQGHILWMRVALASVAAATFMFLAAWELWQGQGEVLPSRLPAIIVFLSGGVFFAFRIAAVGWLPFPLGGQMAHPLALAAYNFIVVLHMLAITVLLISLTKERREATQRALAETDTLTNLPNRRAFASEAERLLRRQEQAGAPLALLILDLDHFKSINDRWGHGAGDRVLVEFASLLGRCLRREDRRYRIGGEEFCCLLPGLTIREALGIAKRICETFESNPVDVLGGSVRGTVSIGVTSTEVCGYVLEDLMSGGDAAAYDAKASGRNRAISALALPTGTAEIVSVDVPDVASRWRA